MTPLFLAVLLAGAASAETVPRVQVALKLDQAAAAESQARLNTTEILIGEVLGAGFRRERTPRSGFPCVVRYGADGWSAKLKPEDLARMLSSLRGLWGDRIEFIETEPAGNPGDAGPGGTAVAPLSLAGANDVLARVGQKDLSTGRFGAFYDGNLTAANLPGRTVDAVPGRESGLSSGKPGYALTAVPPKEKTEVPPLNDGHPLDIIIRDEAAQAGVDFEVLRAVVEAKGGLTASARRKSGSAVGLMLVTKGAAAGVGMKDADLTDARANIRVGARLMAELMSQFDGDVHRALAAYQVGARAVIRSGGVPNDPEVKYFLAAYELALRSRGAKPQVKPVQPPKNPNLRRLDEEVREAVREKAEEILPPTGLVRPRDPISKYRKTIKLIADKREMDPWLIESIMRAENPWGDPMRVSEAGAIGLMQIMPDTARMLKIDPRIPVQAIDGGTRHLKYLLGLYNGNRVLAVAAYNAGEGAVDSGIPNYPETKGYVAKVFGYYEDLTGEKVDYAPFMPVPRKRKAKAKP